MRVLLLAIVILTNTGALSQSFEIAPLQEAYKGTIGETIKVPLRFKNTSEKTITLIIRKVNEELGSTQKNYFCIDGNCLDQKIIDYSIKIEPGQTLTNFNVTLEGGLDQKESSLRYLAYNKTSPSHSLEVDLNFIVNEKPERVNIYNSRHITLYDVYPNPAVEYANVAYKLLNNDIKAKILIHNILGNIVGEYILPSMENVLRIKTEELSTGIYFYSLYIENEGVLTRKLIVKK